MYDQISGTHKSSAAIKSLVNIAGDTDKDILGGNSNNARCEVWIRIIKRIKYGFVIVIGKLHHFFKVLIGDVVQFFFIKEYTVYRWFL